MVRLSSQRGQAGVYAIGIAFVIVMVGGLFAFFGSNVQVEAGHVGVVSHWGAIDPNQQPLPPGWHSLTPFGGYSVTQVSVQQQAHSFKEVATGSKEQQNVYVDGAVNYHISPTEAAGIEINGGLDAYVTRIFNPAFQDYIKEVVPSYTTTDILANRSKIRDAVLTKLRDKASSRTAGISAAVTVDDLFITDIHYDKSYTDAIASKQVAAQKLEQTKVEAQAAAAKAQGDAQAVVAKANGDAQATLLQAQAQAQANRELEASLNDSIIQYEIARRWDGHLPQVSGGGNIISLPAPAPKS